MGSMRRSENEKPAGAASGFLRGVSSGCYVPGFSNQSSPRVSVHATGGKAAKVLDPYRTGNMFTVPEAARIVGADRRTAGRWLRGNDSRPVFSGNRASLGKVSFLELAELLVAVRFVKHGGKLEKVRAAHTNARKRWPDIPYPFASKRLLQLGGEIIHESDLEYGKGNALAISQEGQWALPEMVYEAMILFEFNEQDQMASQLYPAGRNAPIVIDPTVASGRPTLVNTGITVRAIRERHVRRKEPIGAIARDLGISPKLVEVAVNYLAA